MTPAAADGWEDDDSRSAAGAEEAPIDDPSAGHRHRGSIASLTTVNYVSTAVGLVTAPVLARSLGPVGRGEVAGATAYSAFAVAVLGLGLPTAVIHFTAARKASARGVFGAVLRYCGIITPLAAVLGVAVVIGPLARLSDAGKLAVLGLMLAAPLNVVLLCLESVVLARGALGTLGRVRLTTVLGSAVTVLLLALAGWLTTDRYVATVVVLVLLAIGMIVRNLRLRPTGGTSIWPLLRFGSQASVGAIANYVSLRFDQVIIAPMLGARQLGIYAVAASIASLPIGLGHAISARTYQEVALANAKDREDSAVKAASYVRMTVVAPALLALAVFVVTPVALPLLFGDAYAGAVVPVMILLPGSVAQSVSATANAVLVAGGSPLPATFAELFGLVITAVGLAMFVTRYEIVGAALVSTFAYSAVCFVLVMFLRRAGVKDMTPRREDLVILLGAARTKLAGALARVHGGPSG